ncbi:hypothetical protein [Dysgonomonas sp. 511]|uniref:hypothetical protein n=1 Tax=Dysgonomonas sp. 511 TaxID=2302930 RepID=UPI0013D0BAE1|nr:hypothetical protein [Dysgonomonas sp. 511]NDV79480.1 hypothetical protein [Dysgonomonas sp. 511]
MVTLKNKKELNDFIEKIPYYIDFLIKELNEKGISGDYIYFEKNIDEVQKFFRQNFFSYSEEKQDIIRLGFWAFFNKLLMDNLGGELIITPKNVYGSGTPMLINYGNLYDKKGKKKWNGIPVDSWLNTILLDKFLGTLQSTVTYIINKYSNGNIKE